MAHRPQNSAAPRRPPAARPRRFHPSLLLLILALLVFAGRAANYFVPAFYALADEHGYLTTAKRLADTGSFVLHQPDPYAFIGETMMQSPFNPTDYYLRQPIGYPLLCAAVYKLAGEPGPFFVNPLLGFASIAAVYVIGKQLKNPLAGALAALVIACHPLVLYDTIKPLSHLPDMALAAWTIAAALAWRKSHRFWQAAAIGLLLGAAILIRYTNVLLALPLLLILLQQRRAVPVKRLAGHLAIASLTLFLALIPLLIYQACAFGSPFRTGYSAGGNAGSFSISYFLRHAPAMAEFLFNRATGMPILMVSALIGIGVLAARDRFTLALLLSWSVPPLFLYAAYYTQPPALTQPLVDLLLYARFGLASFVPLILLALVWPAYLPTKLPRHMARLLRPATAIILTIAAILMSLCNSAMLTTLDNTRNTLLYSYAAAELVREQHIPHAAVILADNQTHYFLDYATDCLIYSPDLFRPAPLAARLQDLDHTPHEFDPARTRQLAALLGNKSAAELDAILRRRLAFYAAAGRPVYLLCNTAAVADWQHRLNTTITPLAESPLLFGLYEVRFSATSATAPRNGL